MNRRSSIHDLQSHFDRLLTGNEKPLGNRTRSKADERPFAEFLAEDKDRASALAALCMRTAEDLGGLAGLEAALDHLSETLGTCPDGMTEYATKLFFIHYGPAREHLQMRSLEERQPLSVQPSIVRPGL